jgi:hypothetical protein
MKIEISISEAMDLLLNDPYASWTHGEAAKLVEWYDELEDELGEPLDFDPIAIRCDWSSYENADEAAEAYGLEAGELSLEWLQEHTTVIEVKGLTFGGKVYYPSSILVMDF